MSKENALKLLVDVRPGNDRLGSLFVLGLLPDSAELKKWKPPSSLRYQVFIICLLCILLPIIAPTHPIAFILCFV